jgi:deoxycytidine triphosphate deaminase
MGLKPDHWITKMAREENMIEPFEEGQVRDGVISYGVSSYGYDIRVADEFKIFTNVYSAVVDPNLKYSPMSTRQLSILNTSIKPRWSITKVTYV